MTAPTSTRSTLTIAAGSAMVIISCLHVAATMSPHWPGWITGELRDGTATADSLTAFWAQPGGFAAVLLLLGLIVTRMGRRGERPPAYVGWVLLGWAGLCVVLIGVPSGFVTGFVPAGLLIAADVQGRIGRRRHERTG